MTELENIRKKTSYGMVEKPLRFFKGEPKTSAAIFTKFSGGSKMENIEFERDGPFFELHNKDTDKTLIGAFEVVGPCVELAEGATKDEAVKNFNNRVEANEVFTEAGDFYFGLVKMIREEPALFSAFEFAASTIGCEIKDETSLRTNLVSVCVRAKGISKNRFLQICAEAVESTHSEEKLGYLS